jgi:hypothetical protein
MAGRITFNMDAELRLCLIFFVTVFAPLLTVPDGRKIVAEILGEPWESTKPVILLLPDLWPSLATITMADRQHMTRFSKALIRLRESNA